MHLILSRNLQLLIERLVRKLGLGISGLLLPGLRQRRDCIAKEIIPSQSNGSIPSDNQQSSASHSVEWIKLFKMATSEVSTREIQPNSFNPTGQFQEEFANSPVGNW